MCFRVWLGLLKPAIEVGDHVGLAQYFLTGKTKRQKVHAKQNPNQVCLIRLPLSLKRDNSYHLWNDSVGSSLQNSCIIPFNLTFAKIPVN